MNVIEQLAITFTLELLQEVVKNPAKAAEFKTQLLSIASDIQAAYGVTPPATAS